ncbi:hypothetical protein [Pedobacter sp. ASV28]|uniref:hypothetical protein n=1 Tax=Pedobacter sp. ASV28 TaxID=2795123 RepID=UPI0018EC072A|nr:hypothetical protein [Pedobacter sp. ASV28]
MKRIYFTLSILIIGTAVMAYLYFSNLNTENNSNDHPLNIVSKNSGIVFTFENDKSFFEILNGQRILGQLLGAKKTKTLIALQQNLSINKPINQLVDGENIYIGFLPGKNNQVDFIISTQAKFEIDQNRLIQLGNNKEFKIEKNGAYSKLTFPDSSFCYLITDKKTMIVSNSPDALVNLIDNHTKNDFAAYIKQNNRFGKNTLANIYIDYNKIPKLLKSILNSNINGELNIFNRQNTYASFNYNFSSEKLLLNGYTDIQDKNNYYRLYLDQKEQKIFIDQAFPEQTANYTIFAITDKEKWNSAFKNWQQDHKEAEKIAKTLKELNEKYRIDIYQTFPKYFNKQLATFQLSSGEKFGLLALENGDKLGQLLLDLSTEYEPEIRIFKEADLLYYFFGEPFKKFERPFYTIIDNYFVIANNASSIKVFLNSYRNNKLLVNNAVYMQFKDQISSSATLSIYVNHKNSNDIFGRNLRAAYYKQYKSEDGLKSYNAFGYQLSSDNGRFLSNILLLKQQKEIKLDSLTN